MVCRVCRSTGHISCTVCNTCGHSCRTCPKVKSCNGSNGSNGSNGLNGTNGSVGTIKINIKTEKPKKIDKVVVCPICLDNIKHDKCTTLCGHTFCSSCFLTTFNMKDTCPLCRKVDKTSKNICETRAQVYKNVATIRQQVISLLENNPGLVLRTTMSTFLNETRHR